MELKIYTRDGCSKCIDAKVALDKYNIPFTERVIDRDISRDAVLEYFPGAKMLPIVVVDDCWIGSRDELLLWLANKC